MTDRLTAQQERFCQLLAEGLSQTDAYIGANYNPGSRKSAGNMASRLLEDVRISARVEELRKKAAVAASVDLAWLIREAADTYMAARDERALAAAVSALKEVGVLSGHRVEKSERDLNIKSHEDRLAALRNRKPDAGHTATTTH